MENKLVQKGSHAAPTTYYISIEKDGPYLVYGQPPIHQEIITPDEKGQSWTYTKGIEIENCEEPIALCRCGQSKHKPCCDGTHTLIEWDSEETADKGSLLDKAKPYRGSGVEMVLNDNGKQYCTFARFCDIDGDAWHLIKKASTEADKELLKHEGTHCPSGRLVLVNEATGEVYEPELDPGIGLIEDTVMKLSGPIWVKGGIRVQGTDGNSYQIRNRLTLCRCGHSHNKPFCDGSHLKMEFSDKLPNPLN
ncbi:iron-binding protein [Bacteroidia bacterium]|nr:iron-binding protein [Bacteroidia bacterium]